MYLEPSAMLAIIKEEPDAAVYRERLAVAQSKVISVVGKVEAAISLGRSLRNHELAPQVISQFCDEASVTTVPVYPDLFDEAVMAYRRYGKGTGHPASLNFGDCFSYAYSKRHALPLLFKGDDFAKTDVESAI